MRKHKQCNRRILNTDKDGVALCVRSNYYKMGTHDFLFARMAPATCVIVEYERPNVCFLRYPHGDFKGGVRESDI